MRFFSVKGKSPDTGKKRGLLAFAAEQNKKTDKKAKKGLAFSWRLWDNVCVKIAIKGVTAPFCRKAPCNGYISTLSHTY